MAFVRPRRVCHLRFPLYYSSVEVPKSKPVLTPEMSFGRTIPGFSSDLIRQDQARTTKKASNVTQARQNKVKAVQDAKVAWRREKEKAKVAEQKRLAAIAAEKEAGEGEAREENENGDANANADGEGGENGRGMVVDGAGEEDAGVQVAQSDTDGTKTFQLAPVVGTNGDAGDDQVATKSIQPTADTAGSSTPLKNGLGMNTPLPAGIVA